VFYVLRYDPRACDPGLGAVTLAWDIAVMSEPLPLSASLTLLTPRETNAARIGLTAKPLSTPLSFGVFRDVVNGTLYTPFSSYNVRVAARAAVRRLLAPLNRRSLCVTWG
jgi:hypothetical protein